MGGAGAQQAGPVGGQEAAQQPIQQGGGIAGTAALPGFGQQAM